MGIYATNDNGSKPIEHQELVKDSPMFFEMLTELSGSATLPGIEVLKDNRDGVFTAKFKTHGYGIVITSEAPKENDPGVIYAIATPLFMQTVTEDDIIKLIEGPMTYDTMYLLKDVLLELFIIK